MSQKINPTSNKLGILKLWKYNFQNYGRNFKNYTKFIHYQNFIFNYLNHFQNKYNLVIEDICIVRTFHRATVKVFIHDFQELKTLKNKANLIKTFSCWLNCPITLNIYKKNNLSNSAVLLSNYINYLFLQKSSTPKKILQIIYKILQEHTSKVKIIYTIHGIKIFKLKGFKIEVSGCFESSRSQMAKTLKCNFGSVSLTKLKGYVDYSNNILFTKFGSCGFKIWLFYEVKN